MKKEINLTLSPKQVGEESLLKLAIAKKLFVSKDSISSYRVTRRSVDARRKSIKINLSVLVWIDEQEESIDDIVLDLKNVESAPEVIVVGMGPAGMFAAINLIENGIKPIIFERGKAVDNRKKDISAIYQSHQINPNSNFGFGEGGAGTFSDGKLYTRSKKRGDVRRVLEILYYHGAQSDVLIDAHPHIGTNVLPKVVKNIRQNILDAGGEIHFDSIVSDFIIENGEAKGVVVNNTRVLAKAVILATGHSARDIYGIMNSKKLLLEPKTFAMGVRLEHPQELIDSIQYHGASRDRYLPAASYSFVEQVKGRGVYSFCMCPGGVIVPAATALNELVVNGMSPSSRGGRFANSGLVVEIRPEDICSNRDFDHMSGLEFQSKLEKNCFEFANRSQNAPSQKMCDFVNNKLSSDDLVGSYRPGMISSPMHEWLPTHISERLKQGFKQMGQKANGFLTNEAKIVGVETRTSSPVRIPRDKDTLEHCQVKNLYPCGEGAGYSGGIVSSAIDGQRCAQQIAQKILK